jgi:hypothetical protein
VNEAEGDLELESLIFEVHADEVIQDWVEEVEGKGAQ